MKSGLSIADAEYWCSAWEAEAAHQGLTPDRDYFWDAGRGWIDAQRSFANDPPVTRQPAPSHPTRISR
jgi:hypothetical protein